jgi:hypothetical protein
LETFKKASWGICTSAIVVSTDPLSPILSNSSAVKTQENTVEDSDDSELAGGGDILMEYS